MVDTAEIVALLVMGVLGVVLLSIILAHVHRHAGKLRDLDKRINLMEKADAEMYKEDK